MESSLDEAFVRLVSTFERATMEDLVADTLKDAQEIQLLSQYSGTDDNGGVGGR